MRLYRYRAASGSSGVNPNLGGITALGAARGRPGAAGPVRWELLIQGTDYYLDDSGLWVVLATKLDQNDYLATSFRTAAGTTIGTFPQVDQGPGSNDVLELIAEPQQNQTRRTFRYEMRNVYRVAGADLDVTSLEVGITLNRSERPVTGSAQTYLQQLGLAVPSDPVVVRPRESPLAPRAGSRGRECGERPLHRLPAPRSRSPTRASSRPPRSPTRSTARRSTCC